MNYASISDESRDVAQPGSAPEWGSGGRRFKSAHPDHLLASKCCVFTKSKLDIKHLANPDANPECYLSLFLAYFEALALLNHQGSLLLLLEG